MRVLKKTAISIAVTTTLMSQAIYALPNGKPFKELNALIEENATAIDANGDLIEQNSTAILSLSSELSALDGRLGVLETDVNSLTTRFSSLETVVTNNSNDITLAQVRISAVQTELNSLDTAIATNTQAISDANTAIFTIEVELNNMQSDINNLNNTVSDNLAAIADVEANILSTESHLSELQLDVTTNAAEIATTQNNLNDLTASLASLQAIVDTNMAKIAQTEASVIDAENKLATLTNQYNELVASAQANADASDAAIAALKTELMSLIVATQNDIDANEVELQSLNDELLLLARSNSAIAQDLRDQMLALALLVDSDSTSITALQTQVGTLSSTLTTLNAEYNSLSSLYNNLLKHVNDHHDELANLEISLASLAEQVDLLDPSSNTTNTALFTFTDKYLVDDVSHVDNLRQFFIDTPTNGKWIHAIFNTPAASKVTELCVKDSSDIFSWVRNTENHAKIKIIDSSEGNGYRINYGSWILSPVKVSSRKTSTYQEIDIRSTTSGPASVQYINYSSGSYVLYDTVNFNGFLTATTESDTITTITVADDRFTACGF